MDLDAARDYVRTNHNAVLATLRRDGSPQMSPVTAGVDEAGRIIVSTRETAFKVRNLRRDPRAWLCVLPAAFYGQWIQLAGTATVVSLPDAMDGLVSYYRDISGEHPDWEDYRAAMVRDQRALIVVDLAVAGPDRSG